MKISALLKPGINNDLQKAAQRVKSEFLIIVGADDRVVTPQAAKEFAALIDAQLIELDEDCGHGDPWCALDEFSTLVRGFLSGPWTWHPTGANVLVMDFPPRSKNELYRRIRDRRTDREQTEVY